MGKDSANDVTATIADFLEKIGIPVKSDELPDDTFLPGIEVVNGGLVVDQAKLKYPGDLLHEAGHLAVAPASLRPALSGEVVVPGINPDVLEVVAILWSYAAAIHLGIDPVVVFHDAGYRGASQSLLFGFGVGMFPTLPKLEEFGMAFGESKARESGVEAFPKMVKWLRDG